MLSRQGVRSSLRSAATNSFQFACCVGGRPLSLEMLQTWRPLASLRRHQLPSAVEHVVLVLDVDLKIVCSADRLNPDRLALALHALGDGPRPGERVVVDGELVVENVRICLVQI